MSLGQECGLIKEMRLNVTVGLYCVFYSFILTATEELAVSGFQFLNSLFTELGHLAHYPAHWEYLNWSSKINEISKSRESDHIPALYRNADLLLCTLLLSDLVLGLNLIQRLRVRFSKNLKKKKSSKGQLTKAANQDLTRVKF